MADNPPSLDRQSHVLSGNEHRDREFSARIDAVRSYRQLDDNWDHYGGVAADDRPVEFALSLLEKIRQATEIPAPLVQPISGGVYLEWRTDRRLLYFEVDEESVLRHSRDAFGEETAEDPAYDSAKAYEAVMDFHETAA